MQAYRGWRGVFLHFICVSYPSARGATLRWRVMGRHWYTSLREDVNQMLDAFDLGLVSEAELDEFREFVEFVCFLKGLTAKVYGVWPRLVLENITPQECRDWFRFEKTDILYVCDRLRLPETIVTPTRYSFDCVEALCLFLYRLSYPGKYDRNIPLFGRCISSQSEIVYFVLQHINNEFGHLISSHHLPAYYRSPERLRRFADAVYVKSGALSNCVGFIDGTLRRTCRPGVGQQAAYNGHKRTHGLKFQVVVMLDGIISLCWGPAEGRRSDAHMVNESGVVPTLDAALRFPVDSPDRLAAHTSLVPGAPTAVRLYGGIPCVQYCVFGDKGYTTEPSGCIISAFKKPTHGELSAAEQDFNTRMSRSRIAVEHGLLAVVSDWAYNNHRSELKIWGTPVAHFYMCAVFLENIIHCMYDDDNQVAFYFGVERASLEAYLAM